MASSAGGASWYRRLSFLVIGTGIVLGVSAGVLVKLGNPGNMGLCIACFERDIAGALGLHRAAVVQYLRPEIFGIIAGAFLAALLSRECTARSGSSPAVRFILGAFVMIGALVFLGCPVRMVLRLGGFDGNALFGLGGFIAGIAGGTFFLRQGSTLGKSYKVFSVTCWIMPLLSAGGVMLLVLRPSFLFFSEKGPGSMHAPLLASLGVGLAIGVLGQRSRLCFAGGIRDMILFRSPHLLSGTAGALVGIFLFNLTFGQFNPGFSGQPAAHSVQLWNFLGMALVGLGSVLLGGCPFRQLVLAGQGNGDSVVTVLGMVAGAALAHNFAIAATPGGVSTVGMIAVIAGLVFCVIVGFAAREKR